ncbi:MAG: RNA polymerase sigma factor [Pseudonocardiaceae bacterium]
MTRPDDEEGLRDYLKNCEQEIELQALKLARIYCIDFHELLSRTGQTIWQKWQQMSGFTDDPKRSRYSFRILANHSRNLSRMQRRQWTECPPASHLLDHSPIEGSSWRDPAIEALFRDERLTIYRAIAQLKGRMRDVMSLRALGLNDDEIRAELNMTPTNFATTLSRARQELRGMLGVTSYDDDCAS